MFKTALLSVCLLVLSNAAISNGERQYLGYFQTWSEKWSSQGSNLELANIPEYVTMINLAFMQPDATYNGFLSFAGTGVDFSADGSVVKDAISIAQSKGAKVLISVGGATYTNWDNLNVQAVASFVQDFGLDGVDIDYEPTNPNCQVNNGQVTCDTDAQYQQIINEIRAAIPRPKILSIAGWSIGAYGEGNYANAQPQGSNTGMAINLLKSSAGQEIDQVNIMSYDAGTSYHPEHAFGAYKSYFSGKVLLGVEVPPEAWGGHILSISELDSLCDYVIANGSDGDGMMLWSLQQEPVGKVSDTNPSPSLISMEVCNKLGLQQCNVPLPF